MRLRVPQFAGALVFTVFGTACGGDFGLPTIDDRGTDGPEGAVFFEGAGAAVHEQSCEIATFDDGSFSHGNPISTINLPTLGTTLSVSAVAGGPLSDVPVVAYNSDVAHGDNNEDLQNPPPNGLCPDCDGHMMVFPHQSFNTVGDSPDGGTITLMGFRDDGETTIVFFVGVDQETEFDETITMLIDDGDVGAVTSALGEGSVELVEPTSFPSVQDKVDFVMTGSGAVDNIKICFSPDHDDPPTDPGTGTIGFWKTHPEAWPVDMIDVGGVTYSQDAAIELMKRPIRGDKSRNMFNQLVAAMLNVEIGNDASCIDDTITAANAWLAANPSNVRANSPAWRNMGGGLHDMLTDYNEGRLCAPHRD